MDSLPDGDVVLCCSVCGVRLAVIGTVVRQRQVCATTAPRFKVHALVRDIVGGGGAVIQGADETARESGDVKL